MMLEPISVGQYVADELDARGWTTRYAASLIDDDPVNELWLDMVSCVPLWMQRDIQLSEDEARRLELIFGVPAKTWINIHESFLQVKQAMRN